ncbi:MAG: DUF1152 domain-containing protein [Deltaproteobacteria bacterium]|nr:DUF1152 domain-containing protein [Deltaproteobacteria bacterium]
MTSSDGSVLLPGFARALLDPSIRTVMICGCGGGFDFLHGLMLWPELERLGKSIVLGSYSFGDPRKIGNAEVVFEHGSVLAKRVTASSIPAPHYAPEVHAAGFLDETYPKDAPHQIYAYYARDFTVPILTRLYEGLVKAHDVDAIVLIDGGSDSLMAGDEEGLGDPLEDAVSIATVSALRGPRVKILVTVGLGTDRFNHVSDAATLRAISELTARGGFLGSLGLEPNAAPIRLYRELLEHLDTRHSFRSVLAGSILAAADGWFGGENVPPTLAARVRPGELFLWPLMATIFAFDVTKVAERSLLTNWIREKSSVPECYAAIIEGREKRGVREVENLPRHEEFRNPRGRFF